MNKRKILILLVAIMSLLSNPTWAVVSQSKTEQLENQYEKTLTVTPDKGVTLKERLVLYFVKKQIEKQSSNNGLNNHPKSTGKSQLVAFLLCLFFGVLGIHRFYLGYTGMGILYLFTAGVFGIGWIIDLILLIIPNGLTPKGESRY